MNGKQKYTGTIAVTVGIVIVVCEVLLEGLK